MGEQKSNTVVIATILVVLLIAQPYVQNVNVNITPPKIELTSSLDESPINYIDTGDIVEFEIEILEGSGKITQIVWLFNDGASPFYSPRDPLGDDLMMSHQFDVEGEFLVSALVIGEGSRAITEASSIAKKWWMLWGGSMGIMLLISAIAGFTR